METQMEKRNQENSSSTGCRRLGGNGRGLGRGRGMGRGMGRGPQSAQGCGQGMGQGPCRQISRNNDKKNND